MKGKFCLQKCKRESSLQVTLTTSNNSQVQQLQRLRGMRKSENNGIDLKANSPKRKFGQRQKLEIQIMRFRRQWLPEEEREVAAAPRVLPEKKRDAAEFSPPQGLQLGIVGGERRLLNNSTWRLYLLQQPSPEGKRMEAW
ncbi:hypothetical protein HPP92_020003 [Vanilla planifolia]|uniref:Uncharacterized protein n=1 Tax=Vanilla planifolia TaxID=51239 RepID=A0A835QA30_VANPL|nr:hypothetical protein HPP92_020003 [Vanilla planifolia]